MRTVDYSQLRQYPPPPPPARTENRGWSQDECVRYPGNYYSYYSGQDTHNYRRPYEDNYRDYRESTQSQPYPYRPQYRDHPTRYPEEDRYAPRYPTREPPYPPRTRYEDPGERYQPEYRRESFSEYRDIPSKRRRARNSTYPRDESPPSARTKKKPHRRPETPIREDTSSDSEGSDYSAGSDVESIKSVNELTAKTRQLSTRHSTEQQEKPREFLDYKEWSDQEKKDYYERIELVYTVLDDQLEPPKPKKAPTASGARGPVTFKAKPETLPPAPFVSLKYGDHLERAEKSIAMVDKVSKDPQATESTASKEKDKVQVESKKQGKLGFDLLPFNPKWLYKLDNYKWPDRVEPDHNIRQLTYKKESPTEEYVITRDQVYNLQLASYLQMNAASHIDWYLIAINKLMEEITSEQEEIDPRLKAIQELRYATAYANEYLIDQAVYVNAGCTNLMREHYLEQMLGLETEEHNALILQPYYAKSAFNGEIANVIKDKRQRDHSEALNKIAEDNAASTGEPHKGGLLQKLQEKKKYKQTVSKAKKKDKYGQYDSKGKKSFPKSNKKDGSWKTPKSTSKGFPFNANQFTKKKSKKSQYKPKSRGRDRDYN